MKNTKSTQTIRRGMIFVAVLSLMIIATACMNTGTNAGQGTNTVSTGTQAGSTDNGSTPQTGRTLLSDSPDANHAYLISGDSLDASAKTAMSGFSMQKTQNPDGTTTIALTSSNPEYVNQTYTLQSGQKLYFIERFLGDDSESQEGNLGDDKAIIVDSQGYIVQ